MLLAEHSGQAVDDRKGSPGSWLTRLRQCLREVDLIGQLADTVFVVILPQTKQRAAEALRHRIVAELGPQLPWTLSAIEITEPTQLAQILAHRSAVRDPP